MFKDKHGDQFVKPNTLFRYSRAKSGDCWNNVWVHDACYGKTCNDFSTHDGIRRGRGRRGTKSKDTMVESDYCARTVDEHFVKMSDLETMEQFKDMGYFDYEYEPVADDYLPKRCAVCERIIIGNKMWKGIEKNQLLRTSTG